MIRQKGSRTATVACRCHTYPLQWRWRSYAALYGNRCYSTSQTGSYDDIQANFTTTETVEITPRTTIIGCNSSLPTYCNPASEDDLKLFSREKIAPALVLGVGSRCRHGVPQVIMFASLYKNRLQTRKGIEERITTNTGAGWVRCPLLEKELDRWEKKGKLDAYAERINQDPELKAKIEKLHKEVAPKLRKALLSPEWRERVEKDPTLSRIKELFTKGLIGITMADHVKCLHGHLCDYLLRNHSSVQKHQKEGEDPDIYFENPIGRMVYEDLIKAGFPINGTNDCKQFCSTPSDKRTINS